MLCLIQVRNSNDPSRVERIESWVCAAEFDVLEDILENGTGSARQALIYEANHDLREVVREIVDASVPEAAETLGD